MLRSAKTQIGLPEVEVENQSINGLMGTNNNNDDNNQPPWKDVFCTAGCALSTLAWFQSGSSPSVMDVLYVFVFAIPMVETSVKKRKH